MEESPIEEHAKELIEETIKEEKVQREMALVGIFSHYNNGRVKRSCEYAI